MTTYAPPASPPPVEHGGGEPIAEGPEASSAVNMVVDIPSSPELIVLSSDDEDELDPEEEVKPEIDDEDQAFVEWLEQELQEEGLEEEPQERGQEQDTEGSAASRSSDIGSRL